ncbi:MAG: DUF1223 domain-containing protein [Planctomycetes bacterium]|nr:DUF1223 domain-containing protein [Planctomycetota bacterium]
MRLWIWATLSICAHAIGAEGTQAPAHRVLVELFSSQGCSSCPPAEKMLGDLGARADVGAKIVPLAWHVDYWDRLGWPDRFANKEHTARQEAYRQAWRSRNLMTPQFVVAGRPASRLVPEITTEAARPASLSIDLSARLLKDGRVEATVGLKKLHPEVALPPRVMARVLLFATRVTTVCKAGENAGKTLEEFFPVLNSFSSQRADELTLKNVTVYATVPEGVKPAELGVAVLVEDPQGMTTIECTSGPVAMESGGK